MYQIGDEVAYLDDNNQRTEVIENINDSTVQICMLDGSLFIASIDVILYSLTAIEIEMKS